MCIRDRDNWKTADDMDENRVTFEHVDRTSERDVLVKTCPRSKRTGRRKFGRDESRINEDGKWNRVLV